MRYGYANCFYFILTYSNDSVLKGFDTSLVITEARSYL